MKPTQLTRNELLRKARSILSRQPVHTLDDIREWKEKSWLDEMDRLAEQAELQKETDDWNDL